MLRETPAYETPSPLPPTSIRPHILRGLAAALAAPPHLDDWRLSPPLSCPFPPVLHPKAGAVSLPLRPTGSSLKREKPGPQPGIRLQTPNSPHSPQRWISGQQHTHIHAHAHPYRLTCAATCYQVLKLITS